jgi:hypothetical protein
MGCTGTDSARSLPEARAGEQAAEDALETQEQSLLQELKSSTRAKVFNAENAEGRGGTQREAKGDRAGGAWTLNVAIVASL